LNVWTLVRTDVQGEYSGLLAEDARDRVYNLQADAAVVDIAVSVMQMFPTALSRCNLSLSFSAAG